ncbi:FAST kinase domain-containing protein 2, mitochondrial [Pituophis catenifer annectens]|uniref:FAST kinase domain-containing protein 2, mitochondrial n=1 Tax=Pituophis catenifer annectens TaxID=94852 RepID=UPI003996363A
MNSKLEYFIRSIRRLQACYNAGRSFPRKEIKTTAFGINGYKNSAQSIQCSLYVPSCWFHSSISTSSQNTFVYVGSSDANEQKITNDLDHEQNFKPVQLNSSEEVRNTSKESDEFDISQKFFSDLQKCVSPCDVLDCAAKSQVSLKYVSNCFSTMWMLKKKTLKSQKYDETKMMLEHPQFRQLCQHVMDEAKYMDSNDLAHTLLSVVKLGVPQNTLLVQTLLRTCQERVNEFNTQCISIIANALKVMEKCKNVEALQLGLQLLLQDKVHKISNVFVLQTIMRSIGKDVPLTLKKKLENKMLNLMNHFTVPNAFQMFRVLGEMDYLSVPILNACSKTVIENIEGTQFLNLLNVLKTGKQLRYQNRILYSALADYAASVFYTWNRNEVILLLSAFENLSVHPVQLMDKFLEEVMLHLESLNLKDVIIILRAYSNLNHLSSGQSQEFLDSLNSILNKHLHEIDNMDLLRVVYSFCLAGYLPQLALNQLLQEEILSDLIKSEKSLSMLPAINVCLELDGDSSSTSTILSEKLSSLPKKILDFSYPEIQEALLTLLENENLFQINVQLTQGYCLDFEILMDANRKIALTSTEADQLKGDPNLKRIAVLCPPASAFSNPSQHPKGRLAMKIRHLNRLGYQVILVSYKEFQKLEKDEAVLFFKRQIFLAENI